MPGDKKHMVKAVVRKLARSEYVRSAIADRADLSSLSGRPTPRIIAGLLIIALSYLIGWPVITGLGVLSVSLGKPSVVAVGGPAIYLLSHLVFMVGAYFAGAEHARTVMRWLTRLGAERLLRRYAQPASTGAEIAAKSDLTPR